MECGTDLTNAQKIRGLEELAFEAQSARIRTLLSPEHAEHLPGAMEECVAKFITDRQIELIVEGLLDDPEASNRALANKGMCTDRTVSKLRAGIGVSGEQFLSLYERAKAARSRDSAGKTREINPQTCDPSEFGTTFAHLHPATAQIVAAIQDLDTAKRSLLNQSADRRDFKTLVAILGEYSKQIWQLIAYQTKLEQEIGTPDQRDDRAQIIQRAAELVAIVEAEDE